MRCFIPIFIFGCFAHLLFIINWKFNFLEVLFALLNGLIPLLSLAIPLLKFINFQSVGVQCLNLVLSGMDLPVLWNYLAVVISQG